MKLYKSDKTRFIMGIVIIFIIYSSYYIFIAEHRDTAMLPRKLRHFISFLFTVAVYFAGTYHLGQLKALWMSKIWHAVHISGLCIITVLGFIDWVFLTDNTIPSLSIFARSIQEILISPLLYLAMGLLNKTLQAKA